MTEAERIGELPLRWSACNMAIQALHVPVSFGHCADGLGGPPGCAALATIETTCFRAHLRKPEWQDYSPLCLYSARFHAAQLLQQRRDLTSVVQSRHRDHEILDFQGHVASPRRFCIWGACLPPLLLLWPLRPPSAYTATPGPSKQRSSGFRVWGLGFRVC